MVGWMVLNPNQPLCPLTMSTNLALSLSPEDFQGKWLAPEEEAGSSHLREFRLVMTLLLITID